MTSDTLSVEGLEIPSDVHSLDGFRRWVDTLGERGPRVAFFRGKVHVEMSPQDLFRHEPLVAAVNLELARRARDGNLGRYYLPPTWFTHEAVGLSTEPDGALVTWQSFRDGVVQIREHRPTEVLGRPDMALEVVSRSSDKKDLRDLMAGYARAGVREYWLADGRKDPVDLRILVLEGERFRDQHPDADGFVESPLYGAAFRLVRFVDPAGMPAYRLEALDPRR